MLAGLENLNNPIYAKGKMSELTCAFDWSSTPLGAMESWPACLLITVNTLLDSSIPMLLWWGKERIQFYNDAYLKILDADEKSKHPKALGQPAVECWKEAWPDINTLLEEILTTGKSVIHEDRLIPDHPNGYLCDECWTYSYSPVRDHTGKPEGILAVCIEVAKKNHQLQQSQQQLQSVLDSIAEGVIIIDTDRKPIYANKMAQKLLGYSEAEIKSRVYNDTKWQTMRVNGELLPFQDHPLGKAMATRQPVYNQELAIQPFKGERFYLSMSAVPLQDEHGTLTGGIATFMDITSNLKMLQQKDEFISVASHELKTPVTALKAAVQLMEKTKSHLSPAMLSRLIEQANKSMQKVSNLIENLLNVTRLTQGQMKLLPATFDITRMLNECCHHIRVAESHHLHFQSDHPVYVTADEIRIDQVVTNLVDNAVKYAPNSKDIYLSVMQDENWTKVSVRDLGPGIPHEKCAHLFDRFYRTDYNSIQFSGLGLGLYISAEIIKRHGGLIGVDSEVGHGSTFWFTLPVLS